MNNSWILSEERHVFTYSMLCFSRGSKDIKGIRTSKKGWGEFEIFKQPLSYNFFLVLKASRFYDNKLFENLVKLE